MNLPRSLNLQTLQKKPFNTLNSKIDYLITQTFKNRVNLHKKPVVESSFDDMDPTQGGFFFAILATISSGFADVDSTQQHRHPHHQLLS